MNESQIGILVAAAGILAFAAALYRQEALPTAGLAAVVAATIGVAGFLVVTL